MTGGAREYVPGFGIINRAAQGLDPWVTRNACGADRGPRIKSAGSAVGVATS